METGHSEGKTPTMLQTLTNGLDQLFHRGQTPPHTLNVSQNNQTQGTHQTYGENQRNDLNDEGSESSDATIELSRQSVQSSDDENLFDSRIKDKSTDEKTMKNQIEFIKGIPKNFTSVFNDKSENRDQKEQHLFWQSSAQTSAASITNEINVLKYTHSGFGGKLRLLAELLFNFDTLISGLYLALKIIINDPGFVEYVIPVLCLIFSIFSRLILKLMGDKKRHILQCQFNYNFQKKYFKAKKKQTEKGEKGQRRSIGGYFASDLWENLKIGDIIVIKQNQEFPADVMILDSEYRSMNTDKRNTTLDEVTRATIHTLKEKIIVQSGSDTRFKLRQKQSFPGTMMKNRVVETQKVSPLQVVNSLTGILQWEFNLKGFFCGSFRFTDGTGNFDINTDNIIKRGTFLRSNHKLVCLVLNVGESCMSSMPKYSHNQNSILLQFFQNIKNWFWNVQKQEYRMQLRYSRGIGLFVFSFFMLFEGIQMTIQSQVNFETQILSSTQSPNKNVELYEWEDALQTICWIGVVSICCVPLFFEVVFKALIYMQAHFAEWDLNLIPSNLRFNNLNAMGKLPWISHIITSPSTLEGAQTHKVTYFRVGDQSFYNNENQVNTTSYFEASKTDTTTANQDNTNTQNVTPQNQKTGPKDLEHDDSHVSFSTSEDLQFNFEYLPQQRNHTSFEFNNLKADLFRKNKNDLDSPLLSDFLRALALCHQATHKSKETILDQGPRLSHFRSFIEEEEGQLMFAKQYGCIFAHRKSQVISITLEDRVERYEELAFVHLKLKEGCSKVYIQVLRPFNKSGTIIINLKGPGNAITDTLCVTKGTTRQLLAAEAVRLEKLGFNLQFFCQRELTKGESTSFKQQLDSLNIYQLNFVNELNDLCAEYCKQMKILGIIGLQKVVPMRNTLTVQDCIKNGVKMWLLSQYSKRKTLLNCNNMNLLMNSEHVEITGTSEREIEDSLRSGFYKIFETENKKRVAQGNRADADEDERLEQVKLDEIDVKNNQKSSTKESIKRFLLKLFGGVNNKKISKKNFVDSKKSRILMVSSSTLLIIVRDEGLVKLFLSLSTYCDIIIGSGINPELKGRLAKEVVNFCKLGRDSNQTYVMSIIGSPEDRNLTQKTASDVCCFVMNKTNSKDIELNSDITVQHFYAVTYLLFKHGSQLHRRLVVAGRFHLRKAIFMVMMYFMGYFCNGFSVQQIYKKYFLAIYLSFGFEILAFVCAALYENEAFAFLHRVNGQYKCNATLKVVNTNMLISQSVEMIFDILIILILSGVVINSASFLRPDGYTLQNEGFSTLYDLALIFFTVPLFIKLPRVSQTSLMLLFCVVVFLGLTQVMDQDYDSMTIYFQTPECLFELLLIIGIFALKFQVKRVMRTINPNQSSWDNFNSYVEERLELEQYESFEQLKYFDMENSYNADRLIDVAFVQERRNIHQINQNLLKLTRRTDLTDLVFEYVSQINKRKVGQSALQKLSQEKNQKGIGIENQKIFKESANTIDPYTLSFKQIHQEQDFMKYKLTRFAFDKIGMKDFTYQIVWLVSMYCLLIVQIVLRMFFSASYKQLSAGVNSNQFIFYIIIVICCLLSIYLVQSNQVARKDIVMLALIVLTHIFTIAQIEVNNGFCQDLEVNLTIAALIAFSMINRTIHSKYVLIICWITSFWCLSLNLRNLRLGGPYEVALLKQYPSYQIDQASSIILDLQAYYYFLGIPVFTAVWSIYIYFDQSHIKTNFLVLSRRIKEFKFLKLIMQRLVSESIRKYTDGRIAASSVDLMKNFTIIVVKIYNYKNLETNTEDQQLIYNVFQKIQNSIQKVAARHGVFLLNSSGERFLFVSGVKQFEKNISQKILSIHHTQRACKFAIDLIQVSKEISKFTNQNVHFHAGIHSPTHIACGIIGEIRPVFTIIGNGLLKTDMVCDRAQAMQICLTKDAYDMLGLFGIKMNIKVNGTFQFFANTEKEIVYELQAKHRSKMVMKSNRRNTARQSMGSKGELENQQKNQANEQAQEDQQIPDVLSSTHESGRSQRESETDASGQLQSMMTFNSETKIDNSDATYVQTDYQFQMGAEFKDDQEIANNPALNQQYKLVMRSSWLLSFLNTQSENKFTWQCYFELLNQNIIFSFLILIFIFLGIVLLFNQLVSQQIMKLQLIWIFGLLVLCYTIQYRINKISEQKVVLLEYLHIGLALIFIIEYLAITFVQQSVSNYNSFTQVTIATLVVVCGQRGWRFRNYLLCNLILVCTLIGNQIYISLNSTDPFPKIGEIISTLVLAGLLTHHTNSREIIMRIDYNLNMMLTVEEQKHEEQIKKLMPTQALVSIKKEESFTQQLTDATILVANISGFEEVLSQQTVDLKPHIAHQFIKAIYDKFDLIIEHQNIYKLFSNCKQYIVMSSPTHTTEHSSDFEKVMQAYKVIQVGKAMIQTVQDTKKQWIELMKIQKENIDFSEIQLRFSINTGNLLGYVSGSTFLQYQVLGSPLAHCTILLKYAPLNTINISETTKKLLDKITYISEALDVVESQEIELNEKLKVKTFNVTVSDDQQKQQEDSEQLDDSVNQEQASSSKSRSLSESGTSGSVSRSSQQVHSQ